MARAGAKPQRTDLIGKLPVQTVKGQAYGQAKAQADAQKAIPMAPPPSAPAPAPSAPGPMPGPMPGDLPGLTSPTMRPGTPVTHGLPSGPGAGPEALPTPPDPVVTGLGYLNALGSRFPSEFSRLRDELSASQANQSTP